MTAPLCRDRIAINPVKIFAARAEARSILWAEGEIDLHTAVDELWAAAERDGLVKQLGADTVQRILADAFAPAHEDLMRVEMSTDLPDAGTAPEIDITTELPEDEDEFHGLTSTFGKACREADERVRQQRERQRKCQKAPGAAASTLEAAEYLVRQGDAERFRAWLARHRADERAAILEHLERRRRARP